MTCSRFAIFDKYVVEDLVSKQLFRQFHFCRFHHSPHTLSNSIAFSTRALFSDAFIYRRLISLAIELCRQKLLIFCKCWLNMQKYLYCNAKVVLFLGIDKVRILYVMIKFPFTCDNKSC